jgi:ParB family chromosome partitioning protein
MKFKDKAAMIDLSKIGQPTSKPQGAKTAIGMHAEALFRDEKVTAENTDLKQKLAEFEGSTATRHIDPSKIKPSKWANRHEKSFANKDFETLKNEIASSNGNIQPIKVRHVKGQADQYEVVFGHRRHRACLELGIEVLVIIEDMDDAELFCQMDRENRERSALRPYEAGMTYARALDEGLFPSARKLADSASIDLSQLGKALALARLPNEIIQAFPNPLELQYRWATGINQAIQKDPERVLAEAKVIQAETPRPNATQVLKRLLGGGTAPPPAIKSYAITGKQKQSGQIDVNATARTIAINLKNIDPLRIKEIQDVVTKLIS